jgi:methyl-accepting chemotaxis protein
MKISQKLLALILVGFFGCAAIGLIGYSRLASVYADLQKITDSTIPSLDTLNKANSQFLSNRIIIRAIPLKKDPAIRQQMEQEYLAGFQQLIDGLTQYEKLFSDATDEGLYRKIRAKLELYGKEDDVILDLVHQNKLDDAEQAMSNLSAIGKEVITAFTESLKYNEKLAHDAKQISESNFTSAKWLMTISTLIITGFLALLGWLIFNQVNTGLNSAFKTINKIESNLDFTLRAEVKGSDEISMMLKAFNQLISRIQTNLQDIMQNVMKVGNTADQLQQSAYQVSQGSSSQNASASHMAASVEEMTVSINHVADQAKMTSDQSNDVGRKAEAGQEVISQTVDNIHAIAIAVEHAAKDIQQLEAKGHEIESVINIIQAVAEQTNLLALNAAIEAARAGEQGRGFAVVADEVRTLAARTAQSTKEISDIIHTIQQVSKSAVDRMQEAILKVENGVAGAGQANETMADICEVAQESVVRVADITHAIREQGAATTSIAQQVENVAQMVDENTHAANQTADLANILSTLSVEMNKVVSAYRL